MRYECKKEINAMEDFTLKPCAPWAEKLAATYPEDLSPSDLTELEAHLATCPACKAVHEEYHFLDDRIRDIPVAKLQPKIPFFQLLKLQEDPKQDLSKLDGRAPISPHADVLYHMPKYDATPTTDSEHQGIPLEHEKIGNYRI